MKQLKLVNSDKLQIDNLLLIEKLNEMIITTNEIINFINKADIKDTNKCLNCTIVDELKNLNKNLLKNYEDEVAVNVDLINENKKLEKKVKIYSYIVDYLEKELDSLKLK